MQAIVWLTFQTAPQAAISCAAAVGRRMNRHVLIARARTNRPTNRQTTDYWNWRLVAWHCGRTSVCDRRTFPVLCSTCSWWVTTYVDTPSATRSAN